MALSWAGLVGMAVAFAAGLDHGEGPTDNWVTTIWATLVLVGAATTTVLGVRAMVALHDRAGAVIAATLLAALLSLVVLREAIQGIVG